MAHVWPAAAGTGCARCCRAAHRHCGGGWRLARSAAWLNPHPRLLRCAALAMASVVAESTTVTLQVFHLLDQKSQAEQQQPLAVERLDSLNEQIMAKSHALIGLAARLGEMQKLSASRRADALPLRHGQSAQAHRRRASVPCTRAASAVQECPPPLL